MTNQKKYVVTGAVENGIGEVTTKRLLEEGNYVIGTYDSSLSKKAETFLAENKNIELHEVDHSDLSSLRQFVKKISKETLNGFVNVQMLFEMEHPEQFDHKMWETSIFVNLTMPNFLAHELKEMMVEGSSIVMVTSTEAFVGSFGASAYASTKAAIHNLVMTLANNLGKRNVRANALAAGWIGGVMDTDEVFNMSRKITPLGRLGQPNEIAAVVSFLLSKESSFINGSVITADGGYSGVDTIAKYEFEHSITG